MTENFVAFEFAIRRRRLKKAFTGRKTKILVRKMGVRKGLNPLRFEYTENVKMNDHFTTKLLTEPM